MYERKQKQLLEQIQNIDFELVNSLYLTTKQEQKQSSDEITPIEYMDKYKLYDDYKYYDNIGKKAIREGKLAAVTMAGGQGTRLGHDGPKGTFDIGLDSHKSLFELLCDSLKEEGKKYGVTIPWFIMTSRENNKATIEFFEKHKYFGYQRDKNLFFNCFAFCSLRSCGNCYMPFDRLSFCLYFEPPYRSYSAYNGAPRNAAYVDEFSYPHLQSYDHFGRQRCD